MRSGHPVGRPSSRWVRREKIRPDRGPEGKKRKQERDRVRREFRDTDYTNAASVR